MTTSAKQIVITMSFSVEDQELAEDFLSAPMMLPNDTTFREQYEETFGIVLEGVTVSSSGEAPTTTLTLGEPRPAFSPPPAAAGHPTVKHPEAEPTEAQIRYLRSLYESRYPTEDIDRKISWLKESGDWNRGHVSKWIDELKRMPAAKRPGVPPKAKSKKPAPKPGLYTYTDPTSSTKRYFRAKDVKDKGRVYQELVPSATGGWRWTRRTGWVEELIHKSSPTTSAEAAKWGRVTGHCMVCGHKLTDPGSVAAGIGPVCASRMGR